MQVKIGNNFKCRKHKLNFQNLKLKEITILKHQKAYNKKIQYK